MFSITSLPSSAFITLLDAPLMQNCLLCIFLQLYCCQSFHLLFIDITLKFNFNFNSKMRTWWLNIAKWYRSLNNILIVVWYRVNYSWSVLLTRAALSSCRPYAEASSWSDTLANRLFMFMVDWGLWHTTSEGCWYKYRSGLFFTTVRYSAAVCCRYPCSLNYTSPCLGTKSYLLSNANAFVL